MKLISAEGAATFWRKNASAVYIICWALSLLVGRQMSGGLPEECVSWMRMAAFEPVSIVSLLITTVPSLLITALAANKHIPSLMLLVGTMKAIGFGFVYSAIGICWGSAAWLVRFFLLFSDGIGVLALLWFAIRHISYRGSSIIRDLTYGVCICGMACVIDYWLISPFAVMLA